MPTFENLHKEIKKNCNCLKFGIVPDKAQVYERYGNNLPPDLPDFLSYSELGISPSGKDCSAHCHNRGVSIFKVVDDLQRRKLDFKASLEVRPNLPKIIYFFRILDEEIGVIWYSQNSKKLHCELFKSDQFSVKDHFKFIDYFDSNEMP